MCRPSEPGSNKRWQHSTGAKWTVCGIHLIDAQQSMLTVEFKVNLLRPGMGERLRAVGEVIQAGRSLLVSRVSVWAIQDVDRIRCAEALVTMVTLTERGDRQGAASASFAHLSPRSTVVIC